MMLKIIKFLFWLALVLAVAVFLLSVGLRLFFPPEKLAVVVSKKLNNYLHRKVEIGKVSLTAWNGLEVLNLRVYEPDNQQIFLQSGTFNLRPNFWPLFRGQLEIGRIYLLSPYIQIVRKKDGHFNFEDLLVSRGKEPQVEKNKTLPLALLVSRVLIKNGTINFVDQTGQTLSANLKNVRMESRGISLNAPFSLAAGLDYSLKMPQQINGRLRLTGSVDLSKQKLKMVGEIKSKELVYGENVFGNFSLPFSLESGNLAVTNLQTDAYQGKLKADLRANINNLKVITYDLKLGLIDAELNKIVSANSNYKDKIWGKINTRLELKGKGRNLNLINGQGNFQAVEGKLDKLPLTNNLAKLLKNPELAAINYKLIKSTFKIAGGKIYTDDFFVDSDKLGVNGSGWIGFNQQLEMKFRVKIAKKYSRGALAKYTADKQGRITTEILVKGRLTNPQYKLLLNKTMQTRIEQMIRKKLKNSLGRQSKELPKKY
ncbi:MAG: AsmA-like C-terminal region-containing protein [Elusimicrobiota bacterium]